jgi:predicted acyltransferase
VLMMPNAADAYRALVETHWSEIQITMMHTTFSFLSFPFFFVTQGAALSFQFSVLLNSTGRHAATTASVVGHNHKAAAGGWSHLHL